jgi:hypothetical protein
VVGRRRLDCQRVKIDRNAGVYHEDLAAGIDQPTIWIAFDGALQAQQLVALALCGRTGCRCEVAFTLDLDNLLLHQSKPLDLPDDLPAQTFR